MKITRFLYFHAVLEELPAFSDFSYGFQIFFHFPSLMSGLKHLYGHSASLFLCFYVSLYLGFFVSISHVSKFLCFFVPFIVSIFLCFCASFFLCLFASLFLGFLASLSLFCLLTFLSLFFSLSVFNWFLYFVVSLFLCQRMSTSIFASYGQ